MGFPAQFQKIYGALTYFEEFVIATRACDIGAAQCKWRPVRCTSLALRERELRTAYLAVPVSRRTATSAASTRLRT